MNKVNQGRKFKPSYIAEYNLDWRESLICLHDNHYDRDEDIVLNIYKDQIIQTKDIPNTYDLLQRIADYNFNIIFSYLEVKLCLEKRVKDMSELSERFSKQEVENMLEEVYAEAGKIFNEINISINTRIISVVRDMLDCNEYAYLENHISSPYFIGGVLNPTDCIVFKNNAQQLLLPSLHLEELECLTSYVDDAEIMEIMIIPKKEGACVNVW